MEFTKRKGNANLQLTLTVVGASCGCVARAVRRLPRQRRLRRDVVPLRVDVGTPALMPHRTPRAAVPLDRRARCSPHAGRPARKSAQLLWSTAAGRGTPVQLLGGAPPPSRQTRKDHGVDSRPPRSPLPASGRCLGRFAFEERGVVYLLLLSPSMQTASPFCILCWEPFCCCTVLTREPIWLLRPLLDSVLYDLCGTGKCCREGLGDFTLIF
jgi:hypothetical protein